MKKTKVDLKRQIKHLQKIISLKCLECTNLQIHEVSACAITGCPLWSERPREAIGLRTLIKQLRQQETTIIEAKK